MLEMKLSNLFAQRFFLFFFFFFAFSEQALRRPPTKARPKKTSGTLQMVVKCGFQVVVGFQMAVKTKVITLAYHSGHTQKR